VGGVLSIAVNVTGPIEVRSKVPAVVAYDVPGLKMPVVVIGPTGVSKL